MRVTSPSTLTTAGRRAHVASRVTRNMLTRHSCLLRCGDRRGAQLFYYLVTSERSERDVNDPVVLWFNGAHLNIYAWSVGLVGARVRAALSAAYAPRTGQADRAVRHLMGSFTNTGHFCSPTLRRAARRSLATPTRGPLWLTSCTSTRPPALVCRTATRAPTTPRTTRPRRATRTLSCVPSWSATPSWQTTSSTSQVSLLGACNVHHRVGTYA